MGYPALRTVIDVLYIIAASAVFPLWHFIASQQASTRLQRRGFRGVCESPLSYFTSNDPSVPLRTLTKDPQVDDGVPWVG